MCMRASTLASKLQNSSQKRDASTIGNPWLHCHKSTQTQLEWIQDYISSKKILCFVFLQVDTSWLTIHIAKKKRESTQGGKWMEKERKKKPFHWRHRLLNLVINVLIEGNRKADENLKHGIYELTSETIINCLSYPSISPTTTVVFPMIVLISKSKTIFHYSKMLLIQILFCQQPQPQQFFEYYWHVLDDEYIPPFPHTSPKQPLRNRRVAQLHLHPNKFHENTPCNVL